MPALKAVPIWIEKEKRWKFNKQHNGKRKSFYSSKTGRAGSIDCKRQAAEWIESGDRKDRRLRDAWPDYLKDVKARGSLINYKQRESHGQTYFVPILGHKLVSAITDQDWQDVINAAGEKGVKGKPLAKKSLKNLRGTVTDFYHWAKKARLMDGKPELDIPKKAAKGKRAIIQPGELWKIFQANDNEWYLNAWRLMVVGGYRPSEVFGMYRSEIGGDYLPVNRSVNPLGEITEGGKTDNAARLQKQNIFIRKVIADQIAQLNRAGMAPAWLFPSRDCTVAKYSASYSAWKKFRDNAGIRCTLYELRHTFVSLMKNTLPEDLLKRIVGHSKSMDTLGTYGHEVDGELDEAAGLIEKRLTTLFDHTANIFSDIIAQDEAEKVSK